MNEDNELKHELVTETNLIEHIEQVGKALGPLPGVQSRVDKLLCWIIDSGVDVIKSRFKRSKTKQILENASNFNENYDVNSVIPDIYIPILEGNSKTSSELKTQCYTELLKKAGIEEESSLVHPAFFSILENLCDDEIRYLQGLEESTLGQTIIFYFHFYSPKLKQNQNKTVPLIHYTQLEIENGSHHFHMYQANMLGMGLLVKDDFIYTNNLHIRKEIEDKYIKNGMFKKHVCTEFKIPDHRDAQIQLHSLNMTQLGRAFVKAITGKNN